MVVLWQWYGSSYFQFCCRKRTQIFGFLNLEGSNFLMPCRNQKIEEPVKRWSDPGKTKWEDISYSLSRFSEKLMHIKVCTLGEIICSPYNPQKRTDVGLSSLVEIAVAKTKWRQKTLIQLFRFKETRLADDDWLQMSFCTVVACNCRRNALGDSWALEAV